MNLLKTINMQDDAEFIKVSSELMDMVGEKSFRRIGIEKCMKAYTIARDLVDNHSEKMKEGYDNLYDSEGCFNLAKVTKEVLIASVELARVKKILRRNIPIDLYVLLGKDERYTFYEQTRSYRMLEVTGREHDKYNQGIINYDNKATTRAKELRKELISTVKQMKRK